MSLPSFQLLAESIEAGVAIMDTSLQVIWSNSAYSRLLSLSKSTAGTKQQCHHLLQGIAGPCPLCPVNKGGNSEGFEVAKAANTIFVQARRYEWDGVEYVVETVQNVSQYKKVQSENRRSERLRSQSTMLAGIAHEMNNPLSSISGTAQLMVNNPEKYGLNERGAARMDLILEGVQQAITLLNELAFHSNSKPVYRWVNLNAILKTSANKILSPDSISADFHFPEKDLIIYGSPIDLDNLFNRILSNSIEALKNIPTQSPELKGRIEISAQKIFNRVEVEIKDNGCGMSETNPQKLFDPFYTTKEPGMGYGLGLSICQQIMANHLGEIKILPLEAGTTVRLIFPENRE